MIWHTGTLTSGVNDCGNQNTILMRYPGFLEHKNVLQVCRGCIASMQRDGIVRTPVTPSPINGMPRNCHKRINISKQSALFVMAGRGPKFDGAEDKEERQGSSGGQGWVAAGAARPRRWPLAVASSGREGGGGGGRDEERRERETASP